MVHNVGVGLGRRTTLKRRLVAEKLVKDDPRGPPIAADAVLRRLLVQTLQHFWADVLWCSHGKIGLHLQHKEGSGPKISSSKTGKLSCVKRVCFVHGLRIQLGPDHFGTREMLFIV